MADYVNLIKLSVGSESVDSLIAWQKNRQRKLNGSGHFHVTRMWPKRQGEILNGGSIYWVVQGVIQCRQKILRFQGDGDYARAAELVEQKGVIGTQLQAELDRLSEKGIPVDVVFHQGANVIGL